MEIACGTAKKTKTSGEILRQRREELRLTQQQVATQAHILWGQYHRLETDERDIVDASARVLLSVCAVLQLDPYLFFPEIGF